MAEAVYEETLDGSQVFKGLNPLPPGTYTIWSQKYQGIWTLTSQGEGHGELVTWESVPLKAYIYNRDKLFGRRYRRELPSFFHVAGKHAEPYHRDIVLQNANGDPNQVWSFTPVK
ncbi:hypothetical protein B0H11DRAFT_1946003 [Mycena galericulata]|nr:hypothetical protein B0H11DRAFT_1946003 [Mycena galericulata]